MMESFFLILFGCFIVGWVIGYAMYYLTLPSTNPYNMTSPYKHEKAPTWAWESKPVVYKNPCKSCGECSKENKEECK